jgi:hypothetical protein
MAWDRQNIYADAEQETHPRVEDLLLDMYPLK